MDAARALLCRETSEAWCDKDDDVILEDFFPRRSHALCGQKNKCDDDDRATTTGRPSSSSQPATDDGQRLPATSQKVEE